MCFNALTGLQLRIKGIARTQMDVGRTRCSGEQQFFHYVRDLFGKKHGNIMEVSAGEYVYPFEYELPNNIAYSVEGKYGEIYYGIKVVLDIPHDIDKEVRLPLTLIRYEDLNTMPLLKYPKSDEVSKTFCSFCFCCCCFRNSPLILTASIPFSGYVPGQMIPIAIEMNNQSHVDVKATKISLKAVHTFSFEYPSTCKQVEKYRLDYKIIKGVKSGKYVKIDDHLKVPEMLNPSNDGQCKVFQITYVVKITAIVDDPHENPFLLIPLRIGSFPLLFKDSTPTPNNVSNSNSNSSTATSTASTCDLIYQQHTLMENWHHHKKINKNAQTLYNEVIRMNELWNIKYLSTTTRLSI